MADEKRKLKHTTAEVDEAVDVVAEHTEQIQQNAENLSAEVARAKSAEATIRSAIGLSKINLLPFINKAAGTTSNGITFTRNENGTITATGTSTGTAAFSMISYNTPIPTAWERERKMRLSGVPNTYTANDGIAIAIGVRDDTTSTMTLIGTDRGSEAIFKVPAGVSWCQVFVRINPGITLENVEFRPMITYADVDLEGKTGYDAYEPYIDDLYTIIQSLASRIEALEVSTTGMEEM